jgi:hypothetical protein
MKTKEVFHDRIAVDDSVKNSQAVKGIAYDVNTTSTGKKIFNKIGENKITIGLAQELSKFLLNSDRETYSTQITMLDKEDDLNLLTVIDQSEIHPNLFGFGLSIDGGMENHIEPVLKKTKGYSLADGGLLPFRMIPSIDHDPAITHGNGYFIRDEFDSVDFTDTYYRYLIKGFESVQHKLIQENGEVLLDYPDENLTKDVDVFSVIDLELKIDLDDLAEYFGLVEENINNRRYNGITLFFGKPCTRSIDSGTVSSYRDIIGSNRMNVRQRNLGEEGTQTIIYRIYL